MLEELKPKYCNYCGRPLKLKYIKEKKEESTERFDGITGKRNLDRECPTLKNEYWACPKYRDATFLEELLGLPAEGILHKFYTLRYENNELKSIDPFADQDEEIRYG